MVRWAAARGRVADCGQSQGRQAASRLPAATHRRHRPAEPSSPQQRTWSGGCPASRQRARTAPPAAPARGPARTPPRPTRAPGAPAARSRHTRHRAAAAGVGRGGRESRRPARRVTAVARQSRRGCRRRHPIQQRFRPCRAVQSCSAVTWAWASPRCALQQLLWAGLLARRAARRSRGLGGRICTLWERPLAGASAKGLAG